MAIDWNEVATQLFFLVIEGGGGGGTRSEIKHLHFLDFQ